MISGLSSTGHEIGGTHAASGIAHAFVAAGILTGLASLVSLAVLPHARHFLAKMHLNPSAMPVH